MNEAKKLPRTVKGKRPNFYETPGLDEAMSMIMVLAEEIAVVHDRLDLVERVAASKGVILAKEIETFTFDQVALEAREEWRQGLFQRIFYLLRQQASEAQTNDTSERYEQVLDTIAQG